MEQDQTKRPETAELTERGMWDAEFDTDQYVYGTEANAFLQERFSSIPKGKVLCLADGEGRNAVFLAKQGYDVTSMDISAVAQHKARKLADAHGVGIELVCADLAGYQLGERQWNGIVSISCHLPPNIRRPLFGQVAKALTANGVFLLEGYTPEQLKHQTGGPPSAEFMTTKDTLANELPGLRFEHLVEVERSLVEGINHTGLASVVQAIAHNAPQAG